MPCQDDIAEATLAEQAKLPILGEQIAPAFCEVTDIQKTITQVLIVVEVDFLCALT